MIKESSNNFHNINLIEFEKAINNYFNDYPIIIKKPGEQIIKKENRFDESFNLLTNNLIEIVEQSAKELKTKEEAEIFTTKSDGTIPRVSYNSLTSGINITIGLLRDYYIISKLENVIYLNQMKDDFWLLLAKLQTYGKFMYKEEFKPSKTLKTKYPHLYNKRGQIYKLTRDYFIAQIEFGNCTSLGYLEVKWKRDISTKETINNFIETFKILHQLNHLLWLEKRKNELKKK